MTDLELKRILTAYTREGADREAALKQALLQTCIRKPAPRRLYKPAIAAVLVLALALAALTPPGRALSADLGRAVVSLIETLFPPKEVTVTPEGMEEAPVHTPHGEDPSVNPEGAVTPGYVIYVDEERYTAAEQDGLLVIDPKDPPSILTDDGEPIPPCRLTVEHRPGLPPADAGGTVAAELAESYAQVEEPEESAVLPGALCLRAGNGTDWDDARAEVHIAEDGQGGVYVLTAQYFTEAEEGHGARFAAMIATFRTVG